jgi:hypothetical protein
LLTILFWLVDVPAVTAALKARLVRRFFNMGGELKGELRELGESESDEEDD